MTPVETLRAAAQKVRETASRAVHQGRDQYVTSHTKASRSPVVVDDTERPTVLIETWAERLEDVNAWIALASPALAPTIVAWLKGAADDLASALNAYPFADEECDPEELLDLCDEPDSVRHALALAALITGQDPA